MTQLADGVRGMAAVATRTRVYYKIAGFSTFTAKPGHDLLPA